MKKFFSLTAIITCLIQSTISHAANDPLYVSGKSYGKSDHLPAISSLAIGKDDFLVVASANKVLIYDPAKEQSVRSFDSGFGIITVSNRHTLCRAGL